MASTFLIVTIGLLTVTGLLATGVGVSRLRTWLTMRRLDPSGPVAAGEGLQEIEGRAHAVDGTITAPFTDAESLICNHKVERKGRYFPIEFSQPNLSASNGHSP